MKKFKFSSFILAVAMFLSTVSYTSVPVYAGDDPGSTDPSDNGMVISKTATAKDDGTYEITLEAYATGEKIISEVTKDVPTDIVLVLDQSGSMENPIGTISFEEYKDESYYGYTIYHTRNIDHYENRHNGGAGNLYYQLDDGSYVSVNIRLTEYSAYSEVSGHNNSYYYTNRDNLYVKNSDGTYSSVTVTKSNNWNPKYTYNVSGTNILANETSSQGSYSFPSFQMEVYLKTNDTSAYKYEYYYVDENNKEVIIGNSTGDTSVFKTILYKKVINEKAGDSRLEALKDAVTTFTESVAEKSKGADGILGNEDDINHRVAIVGYASRKDSNSPWINTEVFIGTNQYNYDVNASTYYGSALQDMNTASGVTNIQSSISVLDANGATYTNYGLEMANGIMDFSLQSDQKRNRVIVLFTDGYPGKNADDFNSVAAESAIAEAKKAKENGISVYAVGIYSGADATSAGDKEGTNTQAANWFMQHVSSNNGTPQNPSYFLSANDADTLNNIFKQISEKIDTDQSSTTLDEKTVIKDVISPQFELAEGTPINGISVKAYKCTGQVNGEFSWEENSELTTATATIKDGNEINVTGFDFSDHYVSSIIENGTVTGYRGNKLVISFKVEPREGFLGGNNVYTNAEAGVYENSEAKEPVKVFGKPQVNVPIDAVTVDVSDKNIYLLGSITGAKLKSDSVVRCGATVDGDQISGGIDINLDPSVENYGLESWQNQYVNITVEVIDNDGNILQDSSLKNFVDDKEYQIKVTISPKETALQTSSGTPAIEQFGQDKANINVFKPVVTFKDSNVFYGESVPTDYSKNIYSIVWQYGSSPNVVKDTDVTMLGTAPTLNFEYTPDLNKIVNGKINSKEDIGVDVATKINGFDITKYVAYDHKKCEGKTCPKENFEFLLHVDTGILTINKIDGTQGEPYVFTVLKDGTKYTETTIVCDSDGKGTATIKELPAGNYTVVEDTNWSWRYKEVTDNSGNKKGPTVTYDGSNEFASIKSGKTTANADVTNKKTFEYWLNGFSDVVRNVFGQLHN